MKLGAQEQFRFRAARIFSNQRTILAIIVVVVFVIFGAINPQLYNTHFVIAPLLRNVALYTVVGLAQLCALSIGQMNLAVGGMAGIGAMVAGMAFQYWNVPSLVGFILGVAVGALVGLLTGWIIIRTRVNAFIVTLSMSFILLGITTLTYSSLTRTQAFGAMPAGIAYFRNGTLADVCAFGYCGPDAIPSLAIPTLIICLIMYQLYARARVGREILATGANPVASELTGIAANRRVMLAHALSGGLSAVAGIMLAATSGSFSASIGSSFLIPSFLGPILGGTLLIGGVVSIFGTVLGTLLTYEIQTGLSVAGAGINALNIALGSILLVALSVQRLQRLVRRSKEKEETAE